MSNRDTYVGELNKAVDDKIDEVIEFLGDLIIELPDSKVDANSLESYMESNFDKEELKKQIKNYVIKDLVIINNSKALDPDTYDDNIKYNQIDEDYFDEESIKKIPYVLDELFNQENDILEEFIGNQDIFYTSPEDWNQD